MKINVILKEDLPTIGKAGEIKKVTAGYFKNYLLSRGLAVRLTSQSKKKIAAEQERLRQLAEKQKEARRQQKEAIEARSLVFYLKPGVRTAFGSVTRQMIWEEIKKAGVALKKNSVLLKNPLKNLGEFTVEVNLGGNVSAYAKIIIRPALSEPRQGE